jgi:DNA-binding SARP family transcriptional activator
LGEPSPRQRGTLSSRETDRTSVGARQDLTGVGASRVIVDALDSLEGDAELLGLVRRLANRLPAGDAILIPGWGPLGQRRTRLLVARSSVWSGRARGGDRDVGQTMIDHVLACLARADGGTEPVGRETGEARPRIELKVLGRVELSIDGRPPTDPMRYWGSGTTRELLCLLEANRRGLPADAIIDRLWPEAPVEQRRQRLAKHVHRLRSVLGGGDGEVGRRLLQSEGEVRRLDPAIAIATDADTFEAAAALALAEREVDAPEADRALAAADALYAGPYLAEHPAGWTLLRRRRLARLHASVLRARVEVLLAGPRPSEAIDPAERLLRSTPLSERACQLLVSTLVATGEEDRARQIYRAFARRLEREVGVEPGPELARAAGMTPGWRGPRLAGSAPEPASSVGS